MNARHMKVDSSLLQQVLVCILGQTKTEGVGSKESECDLSRLFDDLSEFTSQLNSATGHDLSRVKRVSTSVRISNRENDLR